MLVRPWSPKLDKSVYRAGRPCSTKSALGICLPHSSLRGRHLSAWDVSSRIANLACSISHSELCSPITIHHGAGRLPPTGR